MNLRRHHYAISSINIGGMVSESTKVKQKELNDYLIREEIYVVCIQEWCVQHHHVSNDPRGDHIFDSTIMI